MPAVRYGTLTARIHTRARESESIHKRAHAHARARAHTQERAAGISAGEAAGLEWDGATANALLLACGRAKDAGRAVRVAERCGRIVLCKEVRRSESPRRIRVRPMSES